jgi:hypothetical protein
MTSVPTIAEVDTQGAVKTGFVLKSIRDGKFVELE